VHQVTATVDVHDGVGRLWLALVAEVGNPGRCLEEVLLGNCDHGERRTIFIDFLFDQVEQSSRDVCGRDACGTLENPKFAFFVERFADVGAVDSDDWVISMQVEVAVVFVEQLLSDHVVSILVALADPLASINDCVSFSTVEHGWSFVLQDLTIRIDSDNQRV